MLPPQKSEPNFWGELVVRLREEQKISQRQLASGAGVNRSTLRRIEEGTARGDIDVVERLLNYLGYELEAMTAMSVEQRIKLQADQTSNPNRRSELAASRILALLL